MISVIPQDFLAELTADFKLRRELKLKHLLRLRELYRDMKENDGKIMHLWREAGRAMGYSSETVRHAVADLREYDDATLAEWISRGVSFEQIRSMNELSSMDMLNAPPAQLLTEVYTLGNADGKSMSCDELWEYATSHNPYAKEDYYMNKWVYRSPALVALTSDRRELFISRLKALVAEFSTEMK